MKIPEDTHGWGTKPRDLYGLFGDQTRRVAPGLFNDTDRAWRSKYQQANVSATLFYLNAIVLYTLFYMYIYFFNNLQMTLIIDVNSYIPT